MEEEGCKKILRLVIYEQNKIVEQNRIVFTDLSCPVSYTEIKIVSKYPLNLNLNPMRRNSEQITCSEYSRELNKKFFPFLSLSKVAHVSFSQHFKFSCYIKSQKKFKIPINEGNWQTLWNAGNVWNKDSLHSKYISINNRRKVVTQTMIFDLQNESLQFNKNYNILCKTDKSRFTRFYDSSSMTIWVI